MKIHALKTCFLLSTSLLTSSPLMATLGKKTATEWADEACAYLAPRLVASGDFEQADPSEDITRGLWAFTQASPKTVFSKDQRRAAWCLYQLYDQSEAMQKILRQNPNVSLDATSFGFEKIEDAPWLWVRGTVAKWGQALPPVSIETLSVPILVYTAGFFTWASAESKNTPRFGGGLMAFSLAGGALYGATAYTHQSYVASLRAQFTPPVK